MRRLLPTAALPALFLAACTPPEARPAPPTVVQEAANKADEWQRVASPADRDRIGRLRQAWDAALADARAAGNRREVSAEGDLLRGDAALSRPAPTPGSYQCRMVRLGRLDPKGRAS